MWNSPIRARYGGGVIASRPYHVAQVNIGTPVGPVTSEAMAGFMALLEPVNALADASPGFVWRLQTAEGDATTVRVFDDERFIVNMSVWESLDQLGDFVFRGFHAEVMRRRREWFRRMQDPYTAVWWIPAGTVPTVRDAEYRLLSLRAQGPTPYAFTIQRAFPPPGSHVGERSDDDWFCPA